MDTQKNIFCAFAADELAVASGYHGNGETFVASITPEFNVFPWVSGSDYVMSTDDLLAFGGDGKFALWFDSSFERGTSDQSPTFGNRRLSTEWQFRCVAVEIWTFKRRGSKAKRSQSPRQKVKFKPFSTSYV